MAIGDFKLDGVWYKGKSLPVQSLANQMASKVGQGQSEYGDLTSWSAWIQDDWQDGVGRINPNRNGGFLYGEAESRVPGQLILPQIVRQVDQRDINGTAADCRYMPDTIAGTVTVGAGGYTRVGIKFTTPANLYLTFTSHYIFARIPYGVRVKFAIYTDSSGPNTLVDSSNYDPPEDIKGFYWHDDGGGLNGFGTLSINTSYWLVVYPDDPLESFELCYGTSGYTPVSKSYNGSVWADISGKYCLYTSQYHFVGATQSNAGAGFFRFNGNLYCYSNTRIYKYDTTNDQWDYVTQLVDQYSVSGATVFDDKVYFGSGGLVTDEYNTMTTGEVCAKSGSNGNLFAKWNGYLWRAVGNTLQYSSDGTTWSPSPAIEVGDAAYDITGMAGLGRYFYVATQEALWMIPDGDIGAVGVERFGSVATGNGNVMVSYQGALYITVNGRVVRFSEDGSFQDVWMTREDDVVAGRIGKVWDLCRMNNWLIAYLAGTSATRGKPTVWAYQGTSWHHIATLPSAYGSLVDLYRDFSVFYDYTTSKLWMFTPNMLTYNVRVADYTLNPYNDTDSVYARSAWVEWDWFDGPVREAIKDYDSVTIIGENLSASCYVELYWKDDASTDWELLGTFDSNNEEIRWSIDGGTRPQTRRLKLAVLLISTTATETPRIRAIRVKYHLMVKDWWRWALVVDVSGRSGATQMLADGTVHTLTASEIKDNLEALCLQNEPFIYQDLDGVEYEVKVNDANFVYTRREYNEATSNSWWEGVFSINIEQITTGAYTAP